MNKISTSEAVVERIGDGAVVMIAGFLGAGTPESLVEAIKDKGIRNLTLIANDTAFPDRGVGKLVVSKQAARLIVSHIGTNPETGRQMHAGEVAVELVPQGTLAERIRAGGAGLGGVLTPTGIGTPVEEGKEKITVKGQEFLLELPLRADVALLKAHKADPQGNLVFRGTSRNFNPVMATAADFVAVEADQLVPLGAIKPDEVMLPGIFVDAVVHRPRPDSRKEGE